MVRRHISALVVCMSAGLAGCGGDDGGAEPDAGYNCELETRDDDFSIGMSRTGTTGHEIVIMEATPAPPARFDNTWRIQLLDESGDPVDGMNLRVTPCMPDHGHGTPVDAVATPVGAGGEYTLSPINMWMPGLWRTTIEIDTTSFACTDAEPPATAISFSFCING